MIPILLVFGAFLLICMMILLSESRCDRQADGNLVDASYWGQYTGSKAPALAPMLALRKVAPEAKAQQFGSINAHPPM